MIKRIALILLFVLLLNHIGVAIAEDTTSNLVEEVGTLIAQATPDERKEILAGLIFYMMLVDGEESLDLGEDLNTAGEEPVGEAAKEITAEKYEYAIVFEKPAVEVYITKWKDYSYDDTISCEFDVTVYNNSNIDIEFGVEKLKVNGWNITTEGTYNSIARLSAGEKVKETWQLYDIGDVTDITSLDDIESIDGLFFVGEGDSWGEIITSRELTISRIELERLPFDD